MSNERRVKTVDLVIGAMDDDTVIHLGSGTSFIFIGTKLEWEADKQELTEYHHKDTKLWRNTTVARLNDAMTHLLGGYSLNKSVDLKFLDIAHDAGHFKAKLDDYLAAWTDIGERKVTDIYDRELGDGVVVLYDGMERGKYWFKYEYDKRNEPTKYPNKKKKAMENV